MLILRPHHIRSFKNFVEKKEYLLSEKEFIEAFRGRNKMMRHNKQFISSWRQFLHQLYRTPPKVVCSMKGATICGNCDIREDCIPPESGLHQIAEKVDQKSLDELNITEGEIIDLQHFLSKA